MLKRTTYEALISGAHEVSRTHWYKVERMREITEANDPFDAFLDNWIEESSTIVFYDKHIGKLATDIVEVVSEEVEVPIICYNSTLKELYDVPQETYQWDIIQLEMDGEMVEAEIYHTPTMAAFTWDVNGIFHRGFHIVTGHAVVILKGGKK